VIEVNCSESGAGREEEGEPEQHPGQELSPEHLVILKPFEFCLFPNPPGPLMTGALVD
jgi:hypothetical protein